MLTFLEREIELFQEKFLLKPQTIYFGGGTPSLLETDYINRILSTFELDEIKEVTLEANPVNITERKVKAWSNSRINRLSLGVQSFKETELQTLGRLHNNKNTYSAWKLLKQEGFSNLSLDLIYGLPFQKEEDLGSSIKAALKLEPQHISLYCLSLDPQVPLYPASKDLPPDDQIADLYEFIRIKLKAAGYQQYEISNFARPGFESQHNMAYWSDKSYIGLGPSAAGYICSNDNSGIPAGIRYTNPADLKEYFRDLDQGNIMKSSVSLTEEDHKKEFIFLNLRKTAGFELTEYQKVFNIEFQEEFQDQITQLFKLGLLKIDSGYLKLTPQAYYVSNEIFGYFF